MTSKSLGMWMAFLAGVIATACGPASGPNPCQNVTCGEGRCVADSDRASCLCNPGFVPQGPSCIAAGAVDPCAPNPCLATGRPVCVAQGGLAVCHCQEGKVEVNGQCILRSACSPNPCTAPHRTTCVAENDQPRCVCDPGYAPEGTGCTAEPVWDCSKKHQGTTEDGFEPNECPSQATPYNLGDPAQSHSISPAGDVDWITFTPEGNHVLEVSFSQSLTPLYVDVYGPDSVTSIAAEHRGVHAPTVRFLAVKGDTHYVRVRALRATDTGPYQVRVTDLGLDDFANASASALSLSPGAAFSGAIQYPDDVDMVKMPLQEEHAYGFTAGTTTATGLAVELLAPDGSSVISLLDRTTTSRYVLRPPQAGTYFLRARALTPGTLGTFTVTTEDLGPDDHGDGPADATALNASGDHGTGTFERTYDTDAFSFQTVANRIYAFTCTPGRSASCYLYVRDAAGTLLAQDNSGATGYVAFEAKKSEIVSVSAYAAYGTGGYSYKLEDLGADDHGDTAQTASAITAGQTAQGRIELAGDADFFSFSATGGKIYSVTCTPSTALYTCYTSVRDPSGTNLSSSSAQTGFRANAAGTYTLEVRGSSSYTGSYSVVVADEGADDHGDSATAATALNLGSATAGSIQFAYDKDFFWFSATAGRIYEVACTTTASHGCQLNVRNPSGTSVGSASYGASTRVAFEAASAGTFTVEVSAYGTYTGAYSLTAANLGADDHADTSANATAMTLGAATGGSIETPGDVDVVSVTGSAGHIYRIACTAAQSYLCAMVAKDAAGTTLASTSYGTSTQVTFEAPASGTFYLEVRGYSSGTGAWSATATDLGADDFGDTLAAAGTLTAGAAATNGSIETPYDVDVFGFSMTAGRIYKASCTSTQYYLCALTFKNAAGTVLVASSYGTSTQLTYESTAAGTLYVEVRGSSAYTGTYSIQVADIGADDYGDSSGTASALALATTVNGNIESGGDQDWFAVSLTASTATTVTGTGTGYVYFQVFEPNGTTAVTSASSGTRTFTPTTTGTYYVKVYGYYANTVGTYTLRVQ